MISNMANDNPWLGCLLFWSHLKVNYYYDYYLKKGVLHCCNLILWWLIIIRIFFIQRDLTKKVDLTLFLMNLWSFLFQKYVQQVTFKPKKDQWRNFIRQTICIISKWITSLKFSCSLSVKKHTTITYQHCFFSFFF